MFEKYVRSIIKINFKLQFSRFYQIGHRKKIITIIFEIRKLKICSGHAVLRHNPHQTSHFDKS